MPTPSVESVARITSRAEALRHQIQGYLLECRAETGENLDDAQAAKYRAMREDLDELETRGEFEKSDLARVGSYPGALQRAVDGGSGAEQRGRAWARETAERLRSVGGEQRAVVSGSLDVPVLLDIPPVAIPFPKRLIDVCGNRMQLDSPGLAFEYYKQTAPRVNNAAPVPDLGTKSVSTLTVTAVTDRCRVIAHLSDYMPQRIYWNYPAITSWLYDQMFGCVLDAIEAQVISGDDTGEIMVGILNTSGTTDIAFATDVPTTLRTAVSALQNLGEVPSAWALNPADAPSHRPAAVGDDGPFPVRRLRT
jgi:hypothetical protein